MKSHTSTTSSKCPIEEAQEPHTQEISDLTHQSLASTTRMLTYCNEAKEAGIKVIVQLDNQKEQLDRIQEGLTSMRGTLVKAADNLRAMDKCCGLCFNPFRKWLETEDSGLWKSEEPGQNPSSRRTKGQASSSIGFIHRNMEQVSNVLTNLKNMAIDMETELGVHNEQVELINNMTEANQLRVKDATRLTHNLNRFN